jgi:CMP-N,N'-diacetyllegionaminic acid synthase
MEILGIIPARGGSKGITNKNIRKLNSLPLISHTFDFLQKSNSLSRVIVSTDNYRITKIAKSYNVEVPFMRPKNISGSKTTMKSVVKHALNFLEKKEDYQPDLIMIFQPTTPYRPKKLIDETIKIFKTHNITSLVTVSESKFHPLITFKIKNKILSPLEKNFQNYTNRQSRDLYYQPTGSLYAFWRKTLLDYDSIYGPRIYPKIISESEFNLDIDDMFDFFVSDMTGKYWNNYKIF